MATVNSSHFALVYERGNYGHLTLVYLPLPKASPTQAGARRLASSA